MGGQVGGYCDVLAREGGRWTKQAVEVMGGGSGPCYNGCSGQEKEESGDSRISCLSKI